MSRGDGRRGVHRFGLALSPAVEPTAARRGIDPRVARQRPAELREMASGIHQHVRECVAYLAWRAEHVKVIPVGEHRSRTPEDPIGGSGQTRGKGFHSAGEIALTRGLHDRMNVVVLDRVLDQAEPTAIARRACPSEARAVLFSPST